LATTACGGGHKAAKAPRGKQTPAAVALVARRLTSNKLRIQRQALSPALNAVLPRGRLLPRGSRIQFDAEGWRVSGRFGNVTGTLLQPNKPTKRIEVGLVRVGSRWRVTFMEALP
jgi:hypothetical protein